MNQLIVCGIVIVIIIVTIVIAYSRRKDTLPSTIAGPAIPYVNPSELEDWDDASLFTTVSMWALDRRDKYGIGALNDVERTIASLFIFIGEVSNGGFGQWLHQAPCDLLAITQQALETMGAGKMSYLVGSILEEVDKDALFNEDTRLDYLFSLPDSFHEAVEQKIFQFGEFESEYHKLLYHYVREHWKDVRHNH